MSRGLGRIEREILAALTTKNAAYDAIHACEVYKLKRDADGNRWCNDAQHAAVRRALRSLYRRGLVERLYPGHYSYKGGALYHRAKG
jgi:hypothetical protein